MNEYTYIGSVILTGALLVLCTAVYGLLTPWWKSRTGVGFFALLCSMTFICIVTIYRVRGTEIGYVLGTVSWLLVAGSLFFGVLWNIIYKQFLQGRSDQMSDSRRNTPPGRHEDARK